MSTEQLYQQLKEELRVTEENKRFRRTPPVVSPQVRRGTWTVAGQHGMKLGIKKTNGVAETTKNQKTAVETSNPFSVLLDECGLSAGNFTTRTKEALADEGELTSLETPGTPIPMKAIPMKKLENVSTNSASEGFPTAHYWIGATDEGHEDVWLWIDQEPVQMGTPYWANFGCDSNQMPTGGTSQNCALLDHGYHLYFNDFACSGEVNVICET